MLRVWIFGSDEKLRLSSVPFNPIFARFTSETEMESSLQEIPSQLHELLPLHEDSKVWLWLSRLAFHFNKALACEVADIVFGAVVNAQNHIERSIQNNRNLMVEYICLYIG